jgi:hypothetical protein
MIREVDLVNYIPPFMQVYKEPTETLKAEKNEFKMLWKATDKVLHNRFISTADEYGISRFENILGIYPNANDSLETRRIRVQSRWFNKLPYTIRVLSEKIDKVLGGASDFEIYADFRDTYKLNLTVYTMSDNKNDELEYILSIIVPMNIATNIVYENFIKGTIYCGGAIIETDIITLRQV